MSFRQAVTSLGKIVDPVMENNTALAVQRLWSWRNSVRRSRGNFASFRALRKVTNMVPGFKDDAFKEQSKMTFFKTLEAYNQGNLEELRRLCTGQYFSALKRGMEGDVATHGALQGVKISAFLSEPKILQARLVYNTPATLRQWGTNPDFAQITLHVETRQQPFRVTSADALRRVKRKRAFVDRVETWEEALTPQGQSYYFTESGFTTWERPSQFGTVGLLPVVPRDTGAVRALLKDESKDTGEDATAGAEAGAGAGAGAGSARPPSARRGGKRGKKGGKTGGKMARGQRPRRAAVPVEEPEERVVNYVVLERGLGADDDWKICHM